MGFYKSEFSPEVHYSSAVDQGCKPQIPTGDCPHLPRAFFTRGQGGGMVGGFEIIPIRNFSSPSQMHLQGRGDSKPPSCAADGRPTCDGNADGVALHSCVLDHCQLVQKLPF